MSLDVYLYESPNEPIVDEIAAWIHDDGTDAQRVALADGVRTRWAATGGCDGEYGEYGAHVYNANITHNLVDMARAAGIYKALWHPEACDPPITRAHELIEPLTAGLEAIKADRPGWGRYDFVPWVEQYLAACIEHPFATVRVSRDDVRDGLR